MSTATVAWKDFEDAIRSRVLIALAVVFVLFTVGGTYLFAEVIGFAAAGNAPPVVSLIFSLLGPIVVFVPLIGVMTGYKSVVGERESGQMKLLLSLPHTRRDVVFGKLLGRVAVLAVAIVAGFAAAAGMAVVLYNSFPVVDYTLFTLATVALGAVYLAFAIGLSASTGSGSVALWGSLGFFVPSLAELGGKPVILALVIVQRHLGMVVEAFVHGFLRILVDEAVLGRDVQH